MMKKIVRYIKSRISFQMIASVLLLLIFTMLIMQHYVKNQYFSYLLRETKKTETAVLDAASANLNISFREIVNTGCKIAVDASLKKAVEDAKESDDRLARTVLTLENKLSNIAYYADSIAAVAVVTESGKLLEYGRYWAGSGYGNLWLGDNQKVLNELYDQVIELLKKTGSVRYCVAAEPSIHPSVGGMRMFHLAVPLVGKTANLESVKDILVFSFRLDTVFDASALAGIHQKAMASAYLTDESGKIIYHEDPQYIGMNREDYQGKMNGSENISQKLKYFDWTACISIDTREMEREVDRLYHQSTVIYLILLLLCAMVWQLAIRRVLLPINRIRDAMSKIQLGQNMPKIEVQGTHELWQLAGHYNEMADELKRQQEKIERYYEEKTVFIEQKNRAEMEALESQINAHFLCNTLTAINYNAVENGDDEVAVLLKKLSSILSYTFSRRLIHVTLQQEIEWVEQYLYLQKFRLMEVFDYETDFPQEYGEWPCCKLFLQPFVENSILHGFEGMEKGGKIEIYGQIDESRLKLTVRDNGRGMEPEIQTVIEHILKEQHVLDLSGTGIGIQNVITRLRMYYGSGFKAEMETGKDQGTTFVFWLPIPEGEGKL